MLMLHTSKLYFTIRDFLLLQIVVRFTLSILAISIFDSPDIYAEGFRVRLVFSALL